MCIYLYIYRERERKPGRDPALPAGPPFRHRKGNDGVSTNGVTANVKF